MDRKITCIKLHWHSCKLCCIEDEIQVEITLYRNQSYLAFKEMNGYGVICSATTIQIPKENIEEFFGFLEEIYDEQENDYAVPVCDGSMWDMRMWCSSYKMKTIRGTIEYPLYGKKIEEYIHAFIQDSTFHISPRYFGVTDTKGTAKKP